MDNIRLHQNGSIEMRTITLDDGLVFEKCEWGKMDCANTKSKIV